MARAKQSRREGGRRRARQAVVGGVYCYRLPDGRYGACQAISLSETDGQLVVGTLDLLTEQRPTAEMAAAVKVMRPTFAYFKGAPALCNYDVQLPWWLEEVSVIEPVETFAGPCRSFGSWYVLEAFNAERWRTIDVDVGLRDDTPIVVELGAGAVEFRRDISTLSVGPRGAYEVRGDAALDFARLDGFPSLTTLRYDGSDASIIGFVERHPIRELSWQSHGQSRIDLSGTAVDQLVVSVDGPLTLAVPPTLTSLVVMGSTAALAVEGATVAWPFALTVHHDTIEAPAQGLQSTQCLTLNGLTETGTASLSGYTDLRSLTMRGRPGRLKDVAGLVSHERLAELALFDLYALHGEAWHDRGGWPALDDVLIEGLHKQDAAPLKAALASVPRVMISRARSEAWIAANVDNPLRDWDSDGAAFGKAARTAWKKAKTQAQKLGAAASGTDALAILEAFVVALNRINAKYDIDTMRREEAFEAYLGLARDLGVADEDSGAAFDSWRDF